MNTLELKGGMTEMIANVDNKELLQRLYEAVSDIILQNTSDNIQLSTQQEAQLEAELEASFVPENLVEHKVALEKMSKWLNR